MATIYKLNFSNGECYVGQTSQPIQARIQQHKVTKGRGCPLLAFAWRTYELSDWEVLEDNIPEAEIDAKEISWISLLKPALNTLAGGKSMRGLNHPRAKYTAEQIEQVVDLFLNSTCCYKDISRTTGVEYGTVHDIIKMRSQQWVWENKDTSLIQQAELMRTPSYKFYDADNTEYICTDSLNAFEKAHNISPGTCYRVLKGQKNQQGWSAVPHKVLELCDPQLEKFTLTAPRAQQFLESFDNLSHYQVERLVKLHKPSGDWQVKIIS